MNQPSVNPFEQYQIPATEVASHYVLPGMPDKGEYPSNMGAHTMSFPYVPQTQGIPAPAFPVGAKDCGCGGSSAGPYAYMSNVPAYPATVGGAMYPNQPFPPAVGGAMYPNQPFPPAVGGAMYPNQPFPPAVGGAMYPNQPFPHTAAGAAAPVYPPMRGAQIYPPVNEGELYTEFDGNSLENAAEREPLPALEGQSSEQNSGRNGEARAVISIQNEEEPASPKRRPGRAKASLSQITRKQSAPARKRHKANYPWINV
jgi:hypothetical protein